VTRRLLLAVLLCGGSARAEDGAESWALHGQFTGVVQYHPDFHSPYSGANSLDSGSEVKETTDLSLFAGVRLWQGGEAWINPELDQGFGLSDTLGVAGFPSGEAYKVGKNAPYVRLPRAFFRQVIDLGGEPQAVERGALQLGGTQSADRVTFTAGKFSAVDVFDSNRYAHDPRSDFFNWSVIDAGPFDYAADAWGYTYGIAVDWTQSWWSVRAGAFDMSKEPNGKQLDKSFSEVAFIAELEERHQLLGHPGALRLLGFVNRARMAEYQDAVDLAAQTGGTPELAPVRRRRSRAGIALNLEQELAPDLGVFLRAGINDGGKEAYEFTEINQSVSAGLALEGARWGRPDDTFGLAGVVNGLSSDARHYFAAGGLGILIGDGALPHYRSEMILETYYALRLTRHLALGLDYQLVVDPAYNRDRGPVSIFGLRMHVED